MHREKEKKRVKENLSLFSFEDSSKEFLKEFVFGKCFGIALCFSPKQYRAHFFLLICTETLIPFNTKTLFKKKTENLFSPSNEDKKDFFK
jgi:hypothetical protein